MSGTQFSSKTGTKPVPSTPLVNAMAAHFDGLGGDPQVPWAQWDSSGLQSANRPGPAAPSPR